MSWANSVTAWRGELAPTIRAVRLVGRNLERESRESLVPWGAREEEDGRELERCSS
jgi:hypothetical protein